MKKLVKPIVHLKIPIYAGHISICESIEAAKSYFKNIDFEHYGDDYNGLTIKAFGNNGSLSVIIIFDDIDNIPFHVISHESIHAAWAVLDNSGIKPSYDNQEVLTYLSDWVVKEVFRIKEMRRILNN
ncbi:hypothetical protein [Thorsellia kenyensis]|uniref:Uncharacterized protein n=1 Tax=Thorsellia kenyensis TaxID=1549888 RepID=A0ABV6C7P8_9GAMM